MTAAAGAGDGSMTRALAAGLPAELLAVLATARRYWRAQNAGEVPADGDPLTREAAHALWAEHLDRALAHPAASAYDEVFVAAMRRQRRSA